MPRNKVHTQNITDCLKIKSIIKNGRGRFKSLLHHKFLVGLDENREPIWVSNGSFNLTENAVTNIENVMIFDDPEIATDFFDEFKRIYAISSPLKIRKTTKKSKKKKK